MTKPKTKRHLNIILGDQLNRDSLIFEDHDSSDIFWMAEVAQESTHVWSHKARIAMFLAAMRNFAKTLRDDDLALDYLALDEHKHNSLSEALAHSLERYRVEKLRVVKPGDYRVEQGLKALAEEHELPLEILEDRHFLTQPEDFAEWAEGRKALRMEYFYREQRKRFGILMDGEKPAGGGWNYDEKNRGNFGKEGPGMLPEPEAFNPNNITKAVIKLVEERFADHPGELDNFDWPVTAKHAKTALDDFIDNRLIAFGEYQDAMWTDEPWLYHSRLSVAMNLKLLDPRDVIAAAESAWRKNEVGIAAAEGFIRQILGWREYVRGLYWYRMPDYLDDNSLKARQDLPDFYWTGDTDMECLKQSIGQTLQYGYAHHIQRLMITGLYALLYGVEPIQVHEWYLAVYVDAVEWVELPNTLGMSQYADGGVIASKPYIASGKYIQKMSNYCDHCPYNPAKRHGEDACPVTTLYWDFLLRHEKRFADHPRLALQVRNVGRLNEDEIKAIREQAARLKKTTVHKKAAN